MRSAVAWVVLIVSGASCAEDVRGVTYDVPFYATYEVVTEVASVASVNTLVGDGGCWSACFPLSQNTCCGDELRCVAQNGNPELGRCRVPCGDVVTDRATGERRARVDDPSPCALGQACMVARRTPSLTIVTESAVCLPQAGERDDDCEAYRDPAACADGSTCALVTLEDDGAPDKLACKEACALDVARDTCAQDDERCFPYPLAQPGVDTLEGVCGFPVPSYTMAQLEEDDGFNPVGAFVCNTVQESRYCDDAGAICIGLGETGSSDGFCFAYCSNPAYDEDGDGAIGPDEAREDVRACPPSQTCRVDVGLEVGIAIDDYNSNGANVPCDPAACPRDEPCAACGPGDAHCREVQDGGICLWPFGSCEP